MHGSRRKIPRKNLVRQRCAEGFNSGVKGLISDITYKVDFSTIARQNAEFFKRTWLTGPVVPSPVPTSISFTQLPKPQPETSELHRRN
jgi:hypothetical protein